MTSPRPTAIHAISTAQNEIDLNDRPHTAEQPEMSHAPDYIPAIIASYRPVRGGEIIGILHRYQGTYPGMYPHPPTPPPGSPPPPLATATHSGSLAPPPTPLLRGEHGSTEAIYRTAHAYPRIASTILPRTVVLEGRIRLLEARLRHLKRSRRRSRSRRTRRADTRPTQAVRRPISSLYPSTRGSAISSRAYDRISFRQGDIPIFHMFPPPTPRHRRPHPLFLDAHLTSPSPSSLDPPSALSLPRPAMTDPCIEGQSHAWKVVRPSRFRRWWRFLRRGRQGPGRARCARCHACTITTCPPA